MGNQFKTENRAASIDLTGVHTARFKGGKCAMTPVLKTNSEVESAFKLFWVSNYNSLERKQQEVLCLFNLTQIYMLFLTPLLSLPLLNLGLTSYN